MHSFLRHGVEQQNLVRQHTCGRREGVSAGSAMSLSQGDGVPASPNFLGPPTCAHTVRETTTKFCTVIKPDVRKISGGWTTNANARMFAVANLLVKKLSLVTLQVSVHAYINQAKQF